MMDETYPFVTELRRLIIERKNRISLSIVSGNCGDHAAYLAETSRLKGLEDVENLINDILRDQEIDENE